VPKGCQLSVNELSNWETTYREEEWRCDWAVRCLCFEMGVLQEDMKISMEWGGTIMKESVNHDVGENKFRVFDRLAEYYCPQVLTRNQMNESANEFALLDGSAESTSL